MDNLAEPLTVMFRAGGATEDSRWQARSAPPPVKVTESLPRPGGAPDGPTPLSLWERVARAASRVSVAPLALGFALALAPCISHAQQTKPDVTFYGYEIVNRFPHDPAAFTQGLVWHDGYLYEGTGLEGTSSVRKVKLETGKVVQKLDLPPEFFGEGITIWKDSIIQLTWKNHLAFVRDLSSFQERHRFDWSGEGWGITHDGRNVITSDGSATLTFRDPKSLAATKRLDVTFRNQPLRSLNELEYIENQIWANVWTTDQIAMIDPHTGVVRGVLDLTGLLSPRDRGTARVDVLNGIAYDATQRRIFVTGKNWPKLYEIRLVEKR